MAKALLCMESSTPPRDTAWAMSEENVERVRWGYEAWNRRDFDQESEFFDPEIEWRPASVAGETSTEDFARIPGADAVYHGPEGVRRFWETFIEPWEQVTVDVEELRDSGDCVVAFTRFRAVARNGLKVDMPSVHVFTFRGSKVVRFEAFADRAEALEAAGLSE
jgi:ketosteroid isomerase-like protein